MPKIKNTMLAMSALLVVFHLGQAHADTVIMDFDTPLMPAAVFGGFGGIHIEDGFETTSIAFNDLANPTSHIHGALNLGTGSRVSQLEADAGGAIFRATSGDNFAFTSWDMPTLDTAVTTGGVSNLHVVGFDDGAQVAETILTSAAAGTTVSFGAAFGNVDLVEYWFELPGRGEDPAAGVGLLNLLAEVDNVTFNDAIPAVPEPETYAMLLVGLGLVSFAANRRRTHH